MENLTDLIQSEIVIPIGPLVIILICAILAGLAEIALHYYFHPGLRRELSKLACYVYGSLAWVLPLLLIFALMGDWAYIPITLLLLAAAGAATWWSNHRDADEAARSQAEDGEKLLEAAEQAIQDKRHEPHD